MLKIPRHTALQGYFNPVPSTIDMDMNNDLVRSRDIMQHLIKSVLWCKNSTYVVCIFFTKRAGARISGTTKTSFQILIRYFYN